MGLTKLLSLRSMRTSKKDLLDAMALEMKMPDASLIERDLVRGQQTESIWKKGWSDYQCCRNSECY